MLEYIILGFLMSKEMSGYDLKRKFEISISSFFDASFGSIYPALKRLEEKGKITSREVVEGGKYKKLYAIGAEGRQDFLRWLTAPVEFVKIKHDHLVRIFFYDLLPKETAAIKIRELIGQIEPILQEMVNLKELVGSTAPSYPQQSPYQYSTIIYGIRYYEFILGWCRDLINKLEEESK